MASNRKSKEIQPRTFRAKVINIVDGDTVDLSFDLGFHIYHTVRGRLLNVDTPERGADDFYRAKSLVTTLLDEVKGVDDWISVNVYKMGSFRRWLVDIPGVNEVLAEEWPYE